MEIIGHKLQLQCLNLPQETIRTTPEKKVYGITVKGIIAKDLEDVLGTRPSQGGKVPLQH